MGTGNSEDAEYASPRDRAVAPERLVSWGGAQLEKWGGPEDYDGKVIPIIIHKIVVEIQFEDRRSAG